MQNIAASWKRYLTNTVRIESHEDWKKLDFISRWLIATRAPVSVLTLHSVAIGGLLALGTLQQHAAKFSFMAFAAMLFGLFVAHAVSNLVNDHIDYIKGVDTKNYFRTNYTTHPLIQNFMSRQYHLLYTVFSSLIALASAWYAWHYSEYSLLVAALMLLGALILLFYTWPFKHIGLGELSILLVWGPLMIVGVYAVLIEGAQLQLNGQTWWYVLLASLPYGLSAALVNHCEHIDKLTPDSSKGVRTLPVILGEKNARYVAIAATILMYVIILYLVFGVHFFSPVMLLSMVGLKAAIPFIIKLMSAKPDEVPESFPAWPMWFFHESLVHSGVMGNWFIIALVLELALSSQF